MTSPSTENLSAASMLQQLMKNLSCWACKLQQICMIFSCIHFVSEITDEFLSLAWPMSSLLLLKASQVCLRVPPVYGKMRKGISKNMLDCIYFL